MREDGVELRLVRRACSRLHLDQIRPHGLVYLTAKEAQRLLVKFVHALVDTRMPTAFEYHGSSDKIASPAGDLNPRGLQ